VRKDGVVDKGLVRPIRRVKHGPGNLEKKIPELLRIETRIIRCSLFDVILDIASADQGKPESESGVPG
jgi:hypothetical protein